MSNPPNVEVVQADRDAAEKFGNAWRMNAAGKFGLANLLARHRLSHTPSPNISGTRNDWFNGDVDCDGNTLVTVRLDALQAVVSLIEGFPGYGTCTNSEGRLKDQAAWVKFYNLVAALNPETPNG